jgi:signal transduction histidine kinase
MDGTNGLRFVPKTRLALRVGEQVEVVGFPALGGPSPILREALARRTGQAAPLPPARWLREGALLSRQHDATLVRLEARLVNVTLNRSEQVLELQAGSRGFFARLDSRRGQRRDLVPGSRLELTGVYAGQGGDQASGREIDSFELLLNAPGDITVLERPSWWTLQRVLWALGGTGLLAIVALGWVATLRRQVGTQTGIIQQKIEREAVLEERTRIAREFHDTIEQQLVAVTLQLQAARVRIDESPEFVRHVLQLAESMLRHTQSEARHSVWDLRTRALEPGHLGEAFTAVANYARNGAEVHAEVTVEGEASALPGRLENHLLRIGQEAIANAVKHGGAKNIQIALRYGPGTVQLTVQDDGKGFVVEDVPSGQLGHFGLLGMRERAEKIGGVLKVTTAPGRGTQIMVTVPLTELSLSPQEAAQPYANKYRA